MKKYIQILFWLCTVSNFLMIHSAARQPCSVYYEYDDSSDDSDGDLPSFEPAELPVGQAHDSQEENLLFYSVVSPVQRQTSFMSLSPQALVQGFCDVLDRALRVDYDAYVRKVVEIRENARFALHPVYFESRLRSYNRGFLPLTSEAKAVVVAYFIDRMDLLPCSCKDFIMRVSNIDFFGLYPLSVDSMIQRLEFYESYRRNKACYMHNPNIDFLDITPSYYFNVWLQRHM